MIIPEQGFYLRGEGFQLLTYQRLPGNGDRKLGLLPRRNEHQQQNV